MIQDNKRSNPFTVVSPEGMDAETADALFVEVFTDFPQIQNEGHAFIQGARGCGKSMMFRAMMPDFLCKRHNCSISDIRYLAIHIPIKKTELKLTEFERLKNSHADYALNEHLFCMTISTWLFDTLIKGDIKDTPANLKRTVAFANNTFIYLIREAGWHGKIDENALDTIAGCYKLLKQISVEIYRYGLNYLRKLSFESAAIPYDGPLCGYLDFLLPLFQDLRMLPYLPQNAVYLLIDDADNLNETQTIILNTWIATRTSSDVSIKVSAQIKKYKCFWTSSGNSIDAMHDYHDINISDRYTTAKTAYAHRIKEIVQKRLSRVGINVNPEDFFPEYDKQEIEIQLIAQRIRSEWAEKGVGYRVSDDVTRYARPEYITRLGGNKKARSTYSYAGFAQLVHLSSGSIRYFLEAASVMFDEVNSNSKTNGIVSLIEPNIQDAVVRKQAEDFMFTQFERLTDDSNCGPFSSNPINKLQNLVTAMGETFHEILVSKRSERRIFSIALSNLPDKEISEILKIGVQQGYLHEATIGNKDGTGRTKLYILNRRLAPQFTLDPTSFAGYLFVTNEALKAAMNSRKLFREFGEDDILQLSLFE